MALDSVQFGIDGLVGAAITVLGWVMNNQRADHKDLKEAHDRLQEGMPNTYARRDDVKAALDEQRQSLKEVNQKLDRLLQRQ